MIEKLNFLSFSIELFAAAFLCTYRQTKRKFWVLRSLIGGIVAAAGMVFLSDIFSNGNIILRMLPFFFDTIIIILSISFIFEINIKKSSYYCMLGYSIQHFASCVYITSVAFLKKTFSEFEWIASDTIVIYLIVYILSYAALFCFFVRNMKNDNDSYIKVRDSAETIMIVLPVALVLSIIEKRFCDNINILVICQVYGMIASLLVLWIQYWRKTVVSLKMEMAAQTHVLAERRRQFDQSIANIDVINRKCHDLKYQIQALKHEGMSEATREKAIDEITDAVNFYDDFLHTGNEILDTILMEKSVACRRHHVAFTAMADGKALGFMTPMDLYMMFGNALDNAIEAVREICNEEKRVISVKLKTKGNIIILQIINTHARDIIFLPNGNPKTTRDPDYHGFGVEGIRQIVEKYGGSLSMKSEDGLFILTAVFAN